MGPELIVAILGPLAGGVIGTMGFMSRRGVISADKRLDTVAESVQAIQTKMNEMYIGLPTNYCTKDELASHIRSEEYFHNKMLDQMREMRDEVIILRANSERGSHQ